MSLTDAQIEFLASPFRVDEHAFVNGQVYIKKSAIRHRLNQADPSWKISSPELVSVTGDVVIMSGSLTVFGVTRSDIGTGLIIRTKKDDKTGQVYELPAFEIARNTAKAFKTAATDILARAAVQFGIGEYLKDFPTGVKAGLKNPAALAEALKTLKPVAPPPSPPVATQSPPPPKATPMLDAADMDTLTQLSQRHLGSALDDTLTWLELPKLDEFKLKFPTLAEAMKIVASRMADQERAVTIYQASTLKSTKGSLYLSVDIGFGTVAVLAESVDEVFGGTTYLQNDWQHEGEVYKFNPPARAILGRASNKYPRIAYVEEIDTATGDITAPAVADSAVPFSPSAPQN